MTRDDELRASQAGFDHLDVLGYNKRQRIAGIPDLLTRGLS